MKRRTAAWLAATLLASIDASAQTPRDPDARGASPSPAANPAQPDPDAPGPRPDPAPSDPDAQGPRPDPAPSDPDAQDPQQGVPQRGEPEAAVPDDPLAVDPAIRERIGSDYDLTPPPPVGEVRRSYFPYYEETKGDRRFRLLPPLYLEHTRGVGTTQGVDRQSLYALLYYQRRSPRVDADILFPLAWRIRDRQNHVFVLGPLAHREAPGEHDNWLAPAFFQGSRPKAGYFHSPLLLTTSHFSEEGAFTLVGPFFRDRTKLDVDMGLVPFFFHGDNNDVEGAKRTYTLIPPLLFYHRYREIEQSSLTVAGPVIVGSTPKRSVFDIAPLFFHIQGKPETGGIREHHTTLLPFFHYGRTDERSLFAMPGYLRRVTPTSDTMLTPFYSFAATRRDSARMTVAGPVLPLFFNYTDRDIDLHAWAVAPFYYQSKSPKGHDYLTPLFGKFETYGISRTYWAFPSFTLTTDLHGWESDLHPLIYLGRSDQSSHTVFAPVFWDFANPRGRTTVGFPLYWRFADTADDSVTQIAGNTLYMQKKAVGGTDWQFHLLPFFSYGQDPTGYFWNLLFGLAGYQRSGDYARIKAFWVPIQVAGPGPDRATARAY